MPFIGPRLDVYKSQTELKIVAEIPGIEYENDLTINLQGYILQIEGEVRREYAEDDKGFLVDERFNGPFKRKIRLPKDCALEQMKAEYKLGLLTIHIPLFSDMYEGYSQMVPIRFVKDGEEID